MNEQKIYKPFYQIRVAGTVVDHTNNRESAHTQLRHASAKPAELWRISENGRAELLDRVAV